MAKGKTQTYYDNNPARNKKRLEQQAKYNKTDKGLKIRVNANKANKKLGTYGNGDGKDAAHTKNGIQLASKKANRSKKGIHA